MFFICRCERAELFLSTKKKKEEKKNLDCLAWLIIDPTKKNSIPGTKRPDSAPRSRRTIPLEGTAHPLSIKIYIYGGKHLIPTGFVSSDLGGRSASRMCFFVLFVFFGHLGDNKGKEEKNCGSISGRMMHIFRAPLVGSMRAKPVA